MDHFGPGAELLDINSEGDVINFLGYTEKAVDVNTACTFFALDALSRRQSPNPRSKLTSLSSN